MLRSLKSMNDFQNILSSYKQRFISTNSRSRNYFLTNLLPKFSIDLVKMASYFGDESSLLEQLNQKSTIILQKRKLNFDDVKNALWFDDYEQAKTIIPDLEKKEFTLLKSLITEYKQTENELNSLSFEQDDDDEFDDNDADSETLKQLKKALKQHRELIDGKIKSIFAANVKKIDREFSSFEKVLASHKNNLKDYGKNDLYLGYPFIEGRFASDKLFRAPLVLHRIHVLTNTSKIEITFEESESIINPVFLLAFFVENELEYQKFSFSLETDDYINEAIQTLQKYGITCDIKEPQLELFDSMTKKEYAEKKVNGSNDFSLLYNSVLGLFPISDRNIYNDLEELETYAFEEEDSVSKFIQSNEALQDYLEEQKINRALEQEIKYITELDYSQKNVVKEALTQNIVIEGPPGTGKSQVLSNIVANFVSQGKRVLLVSEKVAAIEVVYNRLGRLSTHALLIKNHITDKQHFYEQLRSVIRAIKDSSSTDRHPSFDEINDSIESRFKRLENRGDLYQFEKEGFTLKDLLQIHQNKSPIQDQVNLNDFNEIKALKQGQLHAEIEKIKQQVETIFSSGLIRIMLHHHQDIPFDLKSDTPKLTHFIQYACDIKYQSDDAEKVLFLKHQLELNTAQKITDDFSNAILKPFDEIKAAIISHQETGLVAEYKTHKEELQSPVYEVIGSSPAMIDLLSKWPKLSTKNKVIGLKKVLGSELKKSFITLDYQKLLSTKENEIFHQIESNIERLKPHHLIPFELKKETIIVLDLMLETHLTTPEEIAFEAFAKGLFKVAHHQNSVNVDTLIQLKRRFPTDIVIEPSLITEELVLIALKLAQSNIQDSKEAIQVLSRVITYELYEAIKDDIEFYEHYEKNYQVMNQMMDQKIEKSRVSILDDILRQIRLKISSEAVLTQFGELKRLSELKRLKSVPDVTKKFTETLLTLFPICLMTPASVSATLVNQKNIFDVVVFDEASQMFTENAVPSIHRSKQIIVAGDSQQLRPSSLFQSRFTEGDDFEDEEEDYNTTAALQAESLLDQSRTKFKSVDLIYHYRSEHKELIDFSNHAFYTGKLVFSSQVKNIDAMPIQLIDVNGLWRDQKNIVEAEKVLEMVKEILLTRRNNESIGIITFNSKQMDLIQELIDEEASINSVLSNELRRTNEQTDADESLFVKNIENVQGDERDIIIFSVAYGHNEKGQLINQFGSLSQVTGENRLNVAITRAKKKIFLIKSIKADDLSPNIENRGNLYFKKYLQYVEKLNATEPLEEFLYQLSDNALKKQDLEDFDSPFEIEVFNAVSDKIKDPRFELKNQVRVGSFRIDIAVYDNVKEQYVLGIECDGAAYHSKPSAVENDYYRQKYLESRGWKIHRVWSTNWWSNQEKEVHQIVTLLNSFN